MDFIDWRKSSDKNRLDKDEQQRQAAQRVRRRLLGDYIEEAIRDAQERGEFSNLENEGKPLNLDDHFTAGDKTLAYGLLKSNGYVPPEIELVREIDSRTERAQAQLARWLHQSQTLRARRFPPGSHEKHLHNVAVEKAAVEYEQELRAINSRILSLNITAPTAMHRPLLRVDELVQQFRAACPPLS